LSSPVNVQVKPLSPLGALQNPKWIGGRFSR
jgi:hypothetical protein